MKISKALTIALVAMSVSCSGAATDPAAEKPTDQTPALDALPRPLTSTELQIVAATNDFSFALFRQLSAAQKDSNVFTSPLSATMALGMTMNGAAGPTYDQMRATLGFGTAPDADINAGYKSLIALLRGLDATVDVRIANSIWFRNGFPLNQSFFDITKSSFDAEATALDFSNPASVKTINDWVSSSTVGKIPTILDKIDPDQVMFLINAIYFKGSWRAKFDVAETKDAQFHGVSGDQPMKLMHRNGKFLYMQNADFEAADLPYGNTAYTMSVLLPRPGKSVETLAASLQRSDWSTWTTQFHEVANDLYLPKFKLEWERTLINDLKSLGMRDAFIPNGADFTRMSPQGKSLFINIVKQKTYVDVNEEGTEAAAVTNVGVFPTSAPVPMRVDRPFIFVIRERLSGTIMFMGKIVKMP